MSESRRSNSSKLLLPQPDLRQQYVSSRHQRLKGSYCVWILSG
nr:MAG TPA: hypothetical protein [Caudoviricetes sp.]